MNFTFRKFYAEPARKPRRNPFSRSRAKRWFARDFPNYKIVRYDGKFSFDIRATRPHVGRIICMRFGKFEFRDMSLPENRA